MKTDIDLFSLFELENGLPTDSYDDMNGSHIYYRNSTTDNKWSVQKEQCDPYDDLFLFAQLGTEPESEAMMVQYGWASPIQADLAPSDHPMRRRVRVFLYLNNSGFAIAMRLDGDSIQVDDNHEAEGPLAEALRFAIEKANDERNN